jgi:hypothetical protein
MYRNFVQIPVFGPILYVWQKLLIIVAVFWASVCMGKVANECMGISCKFPFLGPFCMYGKSCLLSLPFFGRLYVWEKWQTNVWEFRANSRFRPILYAWQKLLIIVAVFWASVCMAKVTNECVGNARKFPFLGVFCMHG